VSRRIFRLLLFAYPRQFRRAYAADMERLFFERLADASARGGAAGFWMRTAVNVLLTAAGERISAITVFRLKPEATNDDLVASAFRRKGDTHRSEFMPSFLQDVRYALRLLRRQPAFALFVILTLAVGIGANTAVFSIINRVLLRPLPYADSQELVRVWGRFDPESGFDFAQFPLSNPEFLDYKAHTRSLQDVAAFSATSLTVGGPEGEPERVPSVAVTGNLFDLLRVKPAMGRSFTADELTPGGANGIILSHGFWQARYGGDPAILGRTVLVNGTAMPVVGVMPDGFGFPRDTTRIWVPMRIDPANPGGRSSHGTLAIGRLAPGVPLETARAEIATLMQDWKARFPQVHTGHYLFLRPMLEDVAGSIRPALMLLLGATSFVLLIVCANVASVVLARGEARTREMAIRGALGGGRARLVRLSLVESAVLAGIGGALGVALAIGGVRALVSIDPTSIPRSAELGVDYRMLLFAVAVSTLCAFLVGVLPAFRAASADLQQTLRDASLSISGGVGHQLFRRGLVTAEVALTVILVLGAGLMLRSFERLLQVEPGFKPEGLISAALALPQRAYPEAAQVDTFYASLIARLESSPAIRSASAGSTVPLWNDAGVWDFEVEGRPAPTAGQPAWNAKAVIVRPGYFETLGVPVVRGRSFTLQDDARGQPVVIVNEALAAKFFPGEDPIGKRLRIAGSQTKESWMTVVGLSASVHTDALADPPPPSYHFLQSQLPRTNGNTARALSIFMRTDGSPEAAMQSLRTAVRELDPSLALYDVQTLASVLDQSVARPRFTTWLLGLFAGIGLLLGASGIYGVLAYTVARRTREIGIRRALGAPSRGLVAQVMGSGLVPVTVGIVLGLVASYWTTRYWSTQLFGISPGDPWVYLTVTAGVLVVAVGAMLVPVLRALRVSPLTALRTE
jgi:putative ABC transport system permease protein